MVGTFFRNRRNELCFAQVEQEEDIAAFRYAVDSKTIRAVMTDGSEQKLNASIGTDVHDLLFPARRLRVATLNHAGHPEREYWADITVG